MTTTMNMNSLEKLIQMATIEQMYSMLQKMKSNTETMDTTLSHEDSFNRVRNLEKAFNELGNQFNELDKEFAENSVIVSKQSNLIEQLMFHVDKLTQRIEQMEKKFEWERSNPPMSNPPMSNPVEPEPCENIVLTVEEQNETTMVMPVVPDLSIIETKEIADEIKELTKSDYLALLDEEVQVKNEVEDDCGEMESDRLPNEEVQCSNEVTEEEVHEVVEEYSEPEVETEDEDEPQVNEVVEKEAVVEEEVEEEEEVVEDDESEEEVFEIEIDGVTYYATSEDNGILYEMLEGGDIGKQVGTIQDGEPIFN